MLWSMPYAVCTNQLDDCYICQIEHSQHRSILNFTVNLLAGLVAYTYQKKKPSLDIDPKGLPALPAAAL